MPGKNSRIGIGTAMAIVMVSLFIDAVQFLLSWIPFIGWLLNILIDGVAVFVFWLWFKMKGVSFFSGKKFGWRLVAFIGGALLDFVPFVDVAAWTIDVVLVISTVWAEDAAENSALLQTVARVPGMAMTADAFVPGAGQAVKMARKPRDSKYQNPNTLDLQKRNLNLNSQNEDHEFKSDGYKKAA